MIIFVFNINIYIYILKLNFSFTKNLSRTQKLLYGQVARKQIGYFTLARNTKDKISINFSRHLSINI